PCSILLSLRSHHITSMCRTPPLPFLPVLLPPPPTSPLFPYTTLFRSLHIPQLAARGRDSGGRQLCHDLRYFRHRDHLAPKRFLLDRKSTRLNSSHVSISYAVFCLKKKINII